MSKCNYPNFNLEIYDKNSQKCIFHCDKDKWFTIDKDEKIKWDEQEVIYFWKELNSYIKPYYDKSKLNQDISSFSCFAWECILKYKQSGTYLLPFI